MNDFKVGVMVISLVDFSGVPKGTMGYIIEDYGTGITIAWDLPDRPLPKDKSPEELAKMWAVDPDCPLRDGFNKATELQYLQVFSERF